MKEPGPRARHPDSLAVAERIRTSLERMLQRFRAELRDPAFLDILPERGPFTIARVDGEDCVYVLVRVPVLLTKVLSEREVKVAFLVGQGLSNKEIARSLRLSPPTVSAHLERIYTKLGVHSRVELAQLSIALLPSHPVGNIQA